jgi:hypothetical protein
MDFKMMRGVRALKDSLTMMLQLFWFEDEMIFNAS